MALLTFSTGFPTNFLAAGVSAEAVTREQDLLNQLQTAEPADSFAIANDLQTLYMQNLRAGGLQGCRWLEEHGKATVQKIEEENLYADFIRFRESGASLRLPHAVPLPLGLRFSEELGQPSVIELETPTSPYAHKASYFLLSDLYFENETITPADLARAREQFRSGNLKEGVQITRHHRTGRHMVKSNAALCKVLWENGYSYVLGWTDNTGFFSDPRWRISGLRVAEPPVIAQQHRLAPVPSVRLPVQFVPRRDLLFAPRAVTLLRYGKPYPVVIEQQDFNGLMPLIHESEQELLKRGRHQSRSIPFWLAVRSLEGRLEGYCLNTLSSDHQTLSCERDYKIDIDRETGIQYFGLALTIARLLFLKQHGRWPESGPVLTNFIPHVSFSYRSLVGLPVAHFHTLGHQLDSINREEADALLDRNPFHFEKID